MNTIKKIAFVGATSAIMLSSFAGAAFAKGPTAGPEEGPGCFGRWRAGSVQYLNSVNPENAGLTYFSVRAGDNSTINADNRATCEAL